MQNSQIGPLILPQELQSTLYDLGGHVLEMIDEGGILIAEHAPGDTPLKEAVHLDQDETYHLFLALEGWFREQGTGLRKSSTRQRKGGSDAHQ